MQALDWPFLEKLFAALHVQIQHNQAESNECASVPPSRKPKIILFSASPLQQERLAEKERKGHEKKKKNPDYSER